MSQHACGRPAPLRLSPPELRGAGFHPPTSIAMKARTMSDSPTAPPKTKFVEAEAAFATPTAASAQAPGLPLDLSSSTSAAGSTTGIHRLTDGLSGRPLRHPVQQRRRRELELAKPSDTIAGMAFHVIAFAEALALEPLRPPGPLHRRLRRPAARPGSARPGPPAGPGRHRTPKGGEGMLGLLPTLRDYSHATREVPSRRGLSLPVLLAHPDQPGRRPRVLESSPATSAPIRTRRLIAGGHGRASGSDRRLGRTIPDYDRYGRLKGHPAFRCSS
jgi:hypothetical protein